MKLGHDWTRCCFPLLSPRCPRCLWQGWFHCISSVSGASATAGVSSGGPRGVLTSVVGTAAVLAGRGEVRGVCIVLSGRDGRYLVPWSSISSLPPIIPGMKRVPDVHGGSGLVLVLSVVPVSPVPIVAVIMRGVVSVVSLRWMGEISVGESEVPVVSAGRRVVPVVHTLGRVDSPKLTRRVVTIVDRPVDSAVAGAVVPVVSSLVWFVLLVPSGIT